MRPKNKRVDKSGGRENERGEKKGEEGKKQGLKREDNVILKSIHHVSYNCPRQSTRGPIFKV